MAKRYLFSVAGGMIRCCQDMEQKRIRGKIRELIKY